MKSYIECFEPGGTIVPDKYFIELKDWKGNPTGHKMVKGPEFVVVQDIVESIKTLGNNIKKYVNVKKNLPKINENSSTINSPSIGTTISVASYKRANPDLSFGSYISNSNISSSL